MNQMATLEAVIHRLTKQKRRNRIGDSAWSMRNPNRAHSNPHPRPGGGKDWAHSFCTRSKTWKGSAEDPTGSQCKMSKVLEQKRVEGVGENLALVNFVNWVALEQERKRIDLPPGARNGRPVHPGEQGQNIHVPCPADAPAHGVTAVEEN